MRRSEYLKDSPPMFESGLLDRFTRVHPAVPALIYLPVIALLFATGVGRVGALSWLVLGGDAATAFTAGFLAGYLAYDMIHYAVHHHVPRSALGKKLRELHMRHHFQDHERGFGVSAPYWDRVFGTAPRPRARG